ncbi:hypothetical protein [Streptomyces bobili]|uniref:hypothetical protein n=1 Tax=Streptomyces bobili TaxID=67280 RepID=UPI0037F91596
MARAQSRFFLFMCRQQSKHRLSTISRHTIKTAVATRKVEVYGNWLIRMARQLGIQ